MHNKNVFCVLLFWIALYHHYPKLLSFLFITCFHASLNITAWGFNYLQVYSNRAACYTKLGAMPEGLKDAEKCIELDPTFSKGYTRKGAIQFFMKEYDKAMETYQAGLKHDPNNPELLDGVKRYRSVIAQITSDSYSYDCILFAPNELGHRMNPSHLLVSPIESKRTHLFVCINQL